MLENLRFKVTIFFKLFFATHVNIIILDNLNKCQHLSFLIYKTFCYHFFIKNLSFRLVFSDLYIFGAKKLDQWAGTLSLKDGCFQAHLLVIYTFLLPFSLKNTFKGLNEQSGLFPSWLKILSLKVCLLKNLFLYSEFH